MSYPIPNYYNFELYITKQHGGNLVFLEGGNATGMAMGSLSIVTGIIFLIDFFFAIKNTRRVASHERILTINYRLIFDQERVEGLYEGLG